MNWKECTWKRSDGKDSGVIQASARGCYILKKVLLFSIVFSTEDIFTLG